jgi:glycosyltransferase involved in cell wall biosynthesis
LFYPQPCAPFHGLSLDERVVGETEASVIRLSDALAEQGHEVIVLSAFKNFPSTKVKYWFYEDLKQLPSIDVFIAVKGWRSIFKSIKAKKKLVWTSDSYTNPYNVGLGDRRVVEAIDGLLLVSEWQKQKICETSGFPASKTALLRKGVHLEDFAGSENRKRKRLIYASRPEKGLASLAYIFLKLKQKHPELELHIYALDQPQLAQNSPYGMILQIFKSMPDCTLHSPILQKQLARELMKSAIWVYPNPIEDTSCSLALEAQAAGCALISSTRGALKEIVGKTGLLIEGDPVEESFMNSFKDGLDLLLSNDQEYEKLREKGLKTRSELDWHQRAKELLQYLKEVHHVE